MTTGAIVYARVSSQEQAQGWSIGTQLDACRAYAAQHDYTVVAEYSDVETGANPDRPGLQRVMADIRAGVAGALIVYQADRLHRDLLHAMQTRRELKLLDVAFHTVRRGKAGDTPEAEFTDAIDDLLAEMERKRIAERTTRGKRGKAMSGQMVGNGPAPYGYLYVGQGRDRHLEIDETTAPTVRKIFDLYAYGAGDGPMPVHQIARTLQGTPTPSDRHGGASSQWKKRRGFGEWAPSHIYPILRNPVYSGQFHAFRHKRVGSKQVQRPASQHIIVPTPALIDMATWNAVQKRIAHGQQQSPRQAKHPYLLGRRIKCACGFRVHGRSSGDATRKRLWYVCNGRVKVTIGTCTVNLPWVRAEPVDQAVWQYVADILASDEKIEDAFTALRLQATKPDTTQRADLERRRAKFQRQKEQLLDLLMAEEIDRLTWRQRTHTIDTQLQAIADELAAIPATPPAPDTTDDETAIKALAAQLRPRLEGLPFAARRRVIEELDVWVTLRSDNDAIFADISSIFGLATASIVL